jgi:uncharacterized phage protein gp47/JayE
MANTTGVLSRLQAALAVYDPSWDVSVGTATYKILEAVAQEIANANNNSVLQTYSYDISTKSGLELDVFCNLFGVYRQFGKRASGVVTFSVNTAATNILDIPVGTQIAVPIGGNYPSAIYFSTIAPAIIGLNDTSVDVPVIATLPGAFGNVPAGTITSSVSTLVGITGINNNNAMSGGLDPESDASLRARWQSTAFNNTTGTQGKYVLTALQDPNVTLANTVSQQTFYNEQLQINTEVSGTGSAATFLLVAYSGMTVNNVTYSGTTVVASSGFPSSTNGSTLASGLSNLINSVAPYNYYGCLVTATSGTNTISGTGVTLTYSNPSPFNLVIGSGTNLVGPSSIVNGVTTVSGISFYNYVQSANPDLGVSGTMSYNGLSTGYLYPEGNELVGTYLNTPSQIVYANLSDYYYPTTPVAPLVINIANGSSYPSLFAGNSLQVITEYNPASSRSVALTSGNYVDVIINGTTANSATEQIVFNPTTQFTLTSGNATSYLNTSNYALASGVTASTNSGTQNDIYVQLNQQPAINFPSQLSTATSGISDSLFLYNTGTSSGTTYPIALNKYPWTTFTGTVVSGATTSGTTFVQVNNANTFLYPGLALATSTIASGTFFIQSVSSSGIYLNQNITAPSGSQTVATMSGKAIVYPIYDITNNSNSVLENTGLAFDATTPPSGWPALPTQLSWLDYTHGYNNDVVTVEGLIEQSRPLGVNTLTHQAEFVNLVLNLRVVFTQGFTPSSVENSIANQLSTYFSTFGYLNIVSFSAIAAQVLSVPGVSNVRLTSVNIAALDGTTSTMPTFTNDFSLASNQLPLLETINFTVKGISNF